MTSPSENSRARPPLTMQPPAAALWHVWVASSNAGKTTELGLGVRRWLDDRASSTTGARNPPQWLFEALPSIASLPECIEDGETFSANARKKALHYSRHTPGLVLADDSGLEVDALGGAPGVRSRRYAGPAASDADNNAKLLADLQGVSPDRRGAQFVCVLALARAGQVIAEYRGVARGLLLDAPRGTNGFGYDPLFLDPAVNKTFAELSAEEKLQHSHRGRALAAMLDWMAKNPDCAVVDRPLRI